MSDIIVPNNPPSATPTDCENPKCLEMFYLGSCMQSAIKDSHEMSVNLMYYAKRWDSSFAKKIKAK